MQPIKPLLENRYLLTAAVLFQVGMTVLMLIPSTEFSSIQISHFDKLAHTGMYALSLLLWVFAFFKKATAVGKLLTWVFLALFFYGMVIEVVQGKWIPDRAFDLWDVLANILGMMMGMVVFYILKPIWPPKE